MPLAHAPLPVSPDRSGAGTGVKPIDLAYLRRFTLGNTELEREVLDLFAEHSGGYLTQLRRAANAKEWHDAAHTLKGSARAVGAWRVGRAAEAAERLEANTDAGAVAGTGQGLVLRRAAALDVIAEALEEAQTYIASMPLG